MTKAEIANEISKSTGIEKTAVISLIEQFMTVVKDSLAHGENVYLRGFGSFIVKTRAEKTARNIRRTIIEEWMMAQKRHHLSDVQVQMARELGFKPDSLRKIDNHKQEPWKTPLPQHIENLYEKRFKREQPEIVKSLKQQLQEDAAKRAAKRKSKDARRKAAQEQDDQSLNAE